MEVCLVMVIWKFIYRGEIWGEALLAFALRFVGAWVNAGYRGEAGNLKSKVEVAGGGEAHCFEGKGIGIGVAGEKLKASVIGDLSFLLYY